MVARGQHRYAGLSWLAAAGVHLAVLALWQGAGERAQAGGDEGTVVDLARVELAIVELVALPSATSEEPGTVLIAIASASDRAGADPQDAMRDSSDSPGKQSGARASGSTGPENFADRSDSSHRSSSLWNTEEPSMMPHTGKAQSVARSTESLERSEVVAFADQKEHRTRARSGVSEAIRGTPESEGQGGAAGTRGDEWLALDPRFDSAPTQERKFVSAAVQTSGESAHKERGPEATENSREGLAGENSHAPDRSNRRVASPFHLGAPTAGAGQSTGAGGKSGRSTASHQGRGSAAQSGQGSAEALASTRASRSDPYFHEMYRRIDKELRFPKKLALALEQGDLVLSFHLDKMGRVRSLKIDKGSGFQEFDSEAVRAFRAAAPFGAVPDALLRSRDRVQVVAPYYFRNPLIR